jgi:autotransporter-associated beta strand protein
MKKASHIVACFGAIILSFGTISQAQTPAFPGALGFGANATGGRNGTVYHVTTLADSGTGSFRDAVSHSGRIIVFDVGGYINLLTAVSASSSLTIAGQTAPGGGIGIMGAEVSFYGQNNIICRHVRFRQGDIHNGSNSSNAGESAINLGATSSTSPATNMIFDHISVEFGSWDSVDAVNTAYFTVQNSIIADPINQQFGAHHEGDSASWIQNIWANAHNRQPLAKANTIYINNVVYNYQAGYTCGNTGGFFSHDIINNYFITGPSTTSAGNDFYQIDANQSTYAYGNLRDSSANGTLGGSATDPNEGGPVLTSPWSSVTPTIPTFDTTTAYRDDVSMSGTFPRDQVDSQVIGNVTSLGTAGRLFNSESDTGLGNSGYGIINGGVTALDSDGDGMPDYWEKAVGLNPNVNDAMTIAADGYANIEHYLNWLAEPHALTATNTPVDVDLWQYTGGFTNVSPVYSVNNASNGAVTLNGDGHTAHFTPALNFFGLGSFQFSVVASDGSACTNTVTVVVVPQSQAQTQPSNLIWVGDGTMNLWAVGSGTNWFDGTNLVAFSSDDNVTFDDTGTNTPAINLAGALSAGTVYVLAEQDYTFGGSGFLAGPTVLFKTGSGQLNINTTNNFTGGITIDEGTVQVGDGVSFSGSIGGNITNNDTLIFNNPGPVSTSASISGSGSLTKNGVGALTLSGTQIFTNLTTINAGSLQFSGTLPQSDITNNGSLILAPSSSVIFSNNLSGSGTLTMSGTALLTLSNANTYSGGTTNTSGGLMLVNNSSIGTGPLIYNGGMVFIGNGAFITNDFTIPSSTSDLSLAGTNNNTGTWAGNIVNLGGGASWRPGSDGGTLIFIGNALQGNHNFIVPRGTVQFASNAVVSATGTATALGRDGSAGNRSANITFKDNSTTTLGVCSLGGGKSGGAITVTIQNNAVLSFGANNLDLHNVTRNTAVTTLRLNGGTTTVGGFTKTQTTYTNVINFNGGVLKAGANNAAFLPVLTVQTDIVQAGGAIIDDGGFAITIAQPLVHDPNLGATLDGGLTKLGTGTLTLSGANTYTGPTMIDAGTLALLGSGSISGSTNIYIAPGAIFDVSQYANTVIALGNGRTLWGGGFVKGGCSFTSGAILAPGSNSFGTLTFSNTTSLAPALMFSTGSTNIFEISHAPLTNDTAVVFGSLTCGGTLIVTNSGGSALAVGDSFKLFNAGSYKGTFVNVILPPLNPGLAWNTGALNTSGVISVVPTPPVLGYLTVTSSSVTLNGSGGMPASNFYVLSSTNLTLPPSNWIRLLTNQFDSNGNFILTNDLDTNAAQNFYRLQLP